MNAAQKNILRGIMNLAWQFVKRNGYSLSEALRVAWRNIKLIAKMHVGIVRFHFVKIDGSIREAFGTLCPALMPQTNGTNRRANDTVQVYFDTEKQEFRCFKRANLIECA